MPKNNSPKRREERRKGAQDRLKVNKVIDCPCGKRHAEGWAGCRGAAR